MRFEAGP